MSSTWGDAPDITFTTTNGQPYCDGGICSAIEIGNETDIRTRIRFRYTDCMENP